MQEFTEGAEGASIVQGPGDGRRRRAKRRARRGQKCVKSSCSKKRRVRVREEGGAVTRDTLLTLMSGIKKTK
jgi:hypothetical protein